MKICTFLWVYYGYPASSYEGVSVEQMRYNCGMKMAQRDNVKPDIVAGCTGFRYCTCCWLCK